MEVEHLGLNTLDCGTSAGKEAGAGTLDYVGVGPTGRVMGVARWMSSNSRPRPDSKLSWTVPDSWTSVEAATVPYAYSTAMYALRTMANLSAGESVLIHEGASPVGQAALHIAVKMGCAPIFTTVATETQRNLILNNFPQLKPQHVLSCADLSFEFPIRMLTRGHGVRVVLSALSDKKFRASLKCMSLWGRFVHYGREDMLKATKFGTQMFLGCRTVFGLSGDHLFFARDDDRQTVAKQVQEGLDSGVVQPIIGARKFSSSAVPSALLALEKGDCTKAVLDVKVGDLRTRQSSQPSSYVLVGGSAAQWLQVGGWLSLNGARNILAAPVSPQGDATIQRANDLGQMFGSNINVLDITSWDATSASQVLEEASKAAPIDAVVVFVEESEGTKVPTLLHDAMAAYRDAALVVLSANPGTAYAMSVLCEKRRGLGLRASCIAGPLHAATDVLSRVLVDSTPAVTVLQNANSFNVQGAVTSNHLLLDLPRSGEALAAMGSTIPVSPMPRLRDIPTRGQRSHKAYETGPIYAFPPLGVLVEGHSSPLYTLATKLMNPLVCVEGQMEGDLVKYAAAVVKTIRTARPHGPYTLLGWSLSTPLTLQVARLLEGDGLRVVTFLVEGDVLKVREWAHGLLVGSSGHDLLEQLLGKDESCATALKIATDAKSWPSALSRFLGSLPACLAHRTAHLQRALVAVHAYLEAIVKHEPQIYVPVRGKLYVMGNTTRSLCSLPKTDPNIERIMLTNEHSDIGIAAPVLAETINKFAAVSKMVTDDEVRQMFS